MINAAERATRTAQAAHALNTAVLKDIELLMDKATARGENNATHPEVIHDDAISELIAAGYTVHINHYSGTHITW